jgi:hypothetical protein
MKGQNNKRKIKKESCGNAGSVESEESQEQASHSFHKPLGIPPTPARFPHSHSSGHDADGKLENQTQVSHFPTTRILSFFEANRHGRRRGFAPRLRAVVVDREK